MPRPFGSQMPSRAASAPPPARLREHRPRCGFRIALAAFIMASTCASLRIRRCGNGEQQLEDVAQAVADLVGNRKLFGAVVPGHNVTGVFECNQMMKIVAEPRQRLGLTPGGANWLSCSSWRLRMRSILKLWSATAGLSARPAFRPPDFL